MFGLIYQCNKVDDYLFSAILRDSYNRPVTNRKHTHIDIHGWVKKTRSIFVCMETKSIINI